MSFAYMPLFTGDYLRDTQHLSMLEHGAYFKLLMHCWDQKGPAPLDERKLHGICNARSKEDITAMQQVLREFFVEKADGWYNERMAREIERSVALSNKRATAGKRGYEGLAKTLKAKKIQAIAGQLPGKSGAIVGQEPQSSSSSSSLSLSPSPEKPKKDCAPAVPSGVSDQVWNDFQRLRRGLRAPVTPTALKGIEREAKKAGMSVEDALRVCCERGWRGFKAEWMEGKGSPLSAGEQALKMIEQRERENGQT